MASPLLTLDPTGARARMLLAARCAPVALAAFAATLLTYAVVVPMARAYAPLGDAASVVLALSLLGLAAGTAELTWEKARRATSAFATFGALAALAAAALSVAALAGAGERVVPALSLAYAVVGAWLLAWNGLALAGGALGRGTATLGMLAGAGFVVGAAATDPMGSAALVAGALTVLGFPAWTWLVRRTLLGAAAGPEPQPAVQGVNA